MNTELLRQLRAMAEALPPGGAVTLPADWLREQLASVEAAREPAPQSKEPDRLLTVAEAAERLNVDRRWIYRHADTLPFRRKIGGTLRFSEQGLTRWLQTRR